MQALKILVIVMGVMILVGLGALFLVIAARLSHKPPPPPSQAAAAIAVPQGARVESMSIGSDRLAVDLLLADGNRRILIIDLATGRQLRTIPLNAAP